MMDVAPFHLVVGMHRSGTSLVARLADLAGLDLGTPGELLPPSADNPTGFWEHAGIVQLNDDLLAQLGGRWQEPSALPDTWADDPRLASFYARAERLIAGSFAQASLPGWKDPRTSVLLPFWSRVVPIAGVVLVIRHPDEVAASLERRNQISAAESNELWLRYTLDVCAYASRVGVVVYGEALADPVRTVEHLASFFGANPPSAEILDEARRATDRSLRHHRAIASASAGLPADVFRLLEDERNVSLLGSLGTARNRTAYAEGLVDRLESAVADQSEQIQNSEKVRRSVTETLELERRVNAERVEGLESERDRARQVLGDRDEELAVAHERLAAKNGRLEVLEAENRHLARRIREHRASVFAGGEETT